MKIGIVGLGYWGKIILKNLVNLGYEDIKIFDKCEIDWGTLGFKFPVTSQLEDLLDRDKVFVITPTSTHFEVCKFFVENKIDIFCEKPLTNNISSTEVLYSLCDTYDTKIFVDWIFTFNPAVNKIKEIFKEKGNPKTIICNRLNYGPQRFDVDAKLDLSSHDLSIALHWFESDPSEIKWIDFKRWEYSTQNDSSIGLLVFDDSTNSQQTSVQINTSWEFGKKNRDYVIEFYDGSFLFWDDSKSILELNGKQVTYDSYSPLERSINVFLDSNFDFAENRKLTLDIINNLESR
jgi:predicted dehydrogenase